MLGLHPRGVKHDADRAAESLAGQVGAELAPHDAVGAVAAAHLAPDDPELGFRRAAVQVLVLLGLVHKGHALPEVKFRVLTVFQALNLNQRRVVVLVAQATDARAKEGGGV